MVVEVDRFLMSESADVEDSYARVHLKEEK
jgi:hypothetical protein